jgi:hypothetical protein
VPLLSTLILTIFTYYFVTRDGSEQARKAQEQLDATNKLRLALEDRSFVQRRDSDDRRLELDSRRVSADDVRIMAELVKGLVELDPRVTVDCRGVALTSNHTRLSCTFKNTGSRPVMVNYLSYSLIDNDTQKVVKNSHEKIDRSGDFTVPPGVNAGGTYDVYLSAAGAAIPHKSHQFILRQRTSPLLVKAYARLSKGYFSQAEIDELAQRKIIYQLDMCRSDLVC